jgi:type IV pilus assembly protein PilX
MKYILHRNFARPKQKGVVLVLALILLTVISLVAMYTMRGSITGEQVSKNLRTQAVAMQAAETALRLCEDAVRTGQATLGAAAFVKNEIPELLAGMPTQWQTRANWLTGAAMTTEIPADLMTTTGMRPLPRPRCMVEQYELPIMGEDKTLTQPNLITVVGYSPDYQADANGNAIAGSEVWLQSVLRP